MGLAMSLDQIMAFCWIKIYKTNFSYFNFNENIVKKIILEVKDYIWLLFISAHTIGTTQWLQPAK